MEKLHDYLIVKTSGKSVPENQITMNNTRLTVILPGVLRIEHSESSEGFTDAATQSIWYRNHGRVHFSFKREGTNITIRTDEAEFTVDTATGTPLCAKVGSLISDCTNKQNLKGTARTLDFTMGRIKLGDGVISKDGAAVIDDSASLLLDDDGMVCPRPQKAKDIYVFAYGHNYIAAVQALYKLTGDVPLIPRAALGNWWSRYRAYTQKEYQDLMLRFKDENIPLSVATIDMDWHWVDIKKRFKDMPKEKRKLWSSNSGWTGYSWNTALFPNPKGFLDFLHGMDMKISVNLHPAGGIRNFENVYPEVAKAMGMDPEEGKSIDFDFTDPRFIYTYFDVVHHPMEEDGVDFWWIDWQQGTKSKMAGLDPLWSLNHYHYLDSARTGKRPMILSRYAGIGSHRYPLGFSGDTTMNWPCLNFQPYFTATAANCGYTWWSHDIGGHNLGRSDDEMYLRWVQLGAFSPILRLHSSSHDLFGKEPWSFGWDASGIASDFMRLRHSMLPYNYTMNYRTHTEGRAICEPLYYTHPEDPGAYQCENSYMFGSELLVAPVTTKINEKTKTASTKVYLPAGRWVNFFTGAIYKGGRVVNVHSPLNTMPVFAREGSIIPMSLDEGNSIKNPRDLKLRVYRGNGSFTLYEDDGETNAFENGECSKTKIAVTEEGKNISLWVTGTKAAPFMPEKRRYTFEFADVTAAEKVTVKADGKASRCTVQKEGGKLIVTTTLLPIESTVEAELSGITALENPPYKERVVRVMSRYNGDNLGKVLTYTFTDLRRAQTREELVSCAKKICDPALRSELLEVLEDME